MKRIARCASSAPRAGALPAPRAPQVATERDRWRIRASARPGTGFKTRPAASRARRAFVEIATLLFGICTRIALVACQTIWSWRAPGRFARARMPRLERSAARGGSERWSTCRTGGKNKVAASNDEADPRQGL
ncbi:hypothetical protein PsYK624_066340 [Phanerochaete sordida]|uniref:Uncharacterized protein n=1 Tax=Phanerochaete sordida TaxID=48140 RepID=A0A9P3G949_9APHY|nr:hypothetical protein PsYK624_066340 [Phanerochaete sordida]